MNLLVRECQRSRSQITERASQSEQERQKGFRRNHSFKWDDVESLVNPSYENNDNKHTSNATIGSMPVVFNIFTARFIKVKKACEIIKSSTGKPVFLYTTGASFAEANQLCIRDEMPLSLTR